MARVKKLEGISKVRGNQIPLDELAASLAPLLSGLLGGGISDGDKGDVDVSGGGTIWIVQGANMEFALFSLAQQTSGFSLFVNSGTDNFTADRDLSIVLPDTDISLEITEDTVLNGTPPTMEDIMIRSFLKC